MSDQSTKPAAAEQPPARECSRCGCQHMYVVGRQGRFGKAVMERCQCRNCGKVSSFSAKKTDAA
jgi:DNA-directed RNA polymerase subunit M/transcription elongation factor TFIIS